MMGKKKRQILPEEDFTIIVHKDPVAPKRKLPVTTSVYQQKRHAPILPPGAKYESNKMHASQRRVQEDCRRTAYDKTFEGGEPGPSSPASGQTVAVEVDSDHPVKKRNRLFEPLAQLRLGGGDSRRLKCCLKCNAGSKIVVPDSCAHVSQIPIERNTVKTVAPRVTVKIQQKIEEPSGDAKQKTLEERFLERQKRFAPPTIVGNSEVKVNPGPLSKAPLQVAKKEPKTDCIAPDSSSSLQSLKPNETHKSHQATKPISSQRKTEESQESTVTTDSKKVEAGRAEEKAVVGRQNEAIQAKASPGNGIVLVEKSESPETTVERRTEADMKLGKRVTYPSRNGGEASPSSKKKRISPIRPPSPSLPPHLQCPPMKHIIEAVPSTSIAEFVEVKKPPLPEQKEEPKIEASHISSTENTRKIVNARKSPPNSIAKRLTIPGIITKPIEEEEPMPKINFINPKVIRTKEGKRILPFFTNKYIFSNHFPCPGLMVNGRKFCCTEQYYTWRKAKFGKNEAAAGAILMSTDPKQMKLIGSSIENFDESGWKRVSWKYMAEANFAKYKQFEVLRYQLMRTTGSILVEASPTDKWWGAGLDIDSPLLKEPRRWPGKNVMGNLLMEIREALAEKQEYQYEVSRAKRSLIDEH